MSTIITEPLNLSPRTLSSGLLDSSAETPIGGLIAKLGDYIFSSDNTILHIFYGAVAANLLGGLPVWLMLIGPASSGKSLLLETLKMIPNVFSVDSVSEEAAFLSGSPKKDIRKDSTGGLLRQIGDHGAVMIKDFTGILSLPPDKMKKMFDVFRQVYDGSWDRGIGADGGRVLHWQGKAAMFAGVTGAIDGMHQESLTLGERWMFCRLGDLNGFSIYQKALENTGNSKWKEELQLAVAEFFEMELDMGFKRPKPLHEPRAREIDRCHSLAKFASLCRSPIMWDHYKKEMKLLPETEAESRIGLQIHQLYAGMRVVGVTEGDRWKALCKIALDSMPRARRGVIDAITLAESNGSEDGVPFQEIVQGVTRKDSEAACRGVVDRAVVELAAHGVVMKVGAGEGKKRVMLTEEARKLYMSGFRGME